MIFGGLQKLTLLDFPNHMACIVFTQGCNLRCPFCHNSALVCHNDDLISKDEVRVYWTACVFRVASLCFKRTL